jgi:hypothetical protein
MPRFRGRRARFLYRKSWEMRNAIDEGQVRRALRFVKSIVLVGRLIAGAAFSLSKPSDWSSLQISAPFVLCLGSLAFISSLLVQFLAVFYTTVVVCSLIAKCGRKASGCYQIAVRTLHLWVALLSVCAFLVNWRGPAVENTPFRASVANELERPMNVLVRVSGLRWVPMKAHHVYSLVSSISTSMNCSPNEVRITHHGTHMAFDRTLRSYNIQENATLEVML